MKTSNVLGFASLLTAVLVAGCAQPSYTGSPYHPGPVVGRGLGTGVGVVAGNAVGGAVGFGEGLVRGAAAPFDPTTRVVRTWQTNVTSDGRSVVIPRDTLVDSNGVPVRGTK